MYYILNSFYRFLMGYNIKLAAVLPFKSEDLQKWMIENNIENAFYLNTLSRSMEDWLIEFCRKPSVSPPNLATIKFVRFPSEHLIIEFIRVFPNNLYLLFAKPHSKAIINRIIGCVNTNIDIIISKEDAKVFYQYATDKSKMYLTVKFGSDLHAVSL